MPSVGLLSGRSRVGIAPGAPLPAAQNMKTICKITLLSLFLTAAPAPVKGQPKPWSQKMAQTVITLWQNYPGAESGRPARWSYEQAVVLKGMERVWRDTGDGDYFKYIQR